MKFQAYKQAKQYAVLETIRTHVKHWPKQTFYYSDEGLGEKVVTWTVVMG